MSVITTGRIDGGTVRRAGYAMLSAGVSQHVGHGDITWLSDSVGGFSQGLSSTTGRTIFASLSGGLAAAATGGNFVTGAMAAAIVHLYNDENGAQKGANHYSRNAENDKFFQEEGLYGRNDLTLDKIQGAGDYGIKQVSAAETAYHRIGEGNENNIKFTSKVALKKSWYQKTWSNRYGRYEFIARPNVDTNGNFTGTYTHVTGAVNMGTLNRGNNPITHLYRDVIPYKKYGNVPN